MHVQFDDGSKKITIDTPAGNSVVLDESAQQITDHRSAAEPGHHEHEWHHVTEQSRYNRTGRRQSDLSAGAALSISAPSLSLSGGCDGESVRGGYFSCRAGSGIHQRDIGKY